MPRIRKTEDVELMQRVDKIAALLAPALAAVLLSNAANAPAMSEMQNGDTFTVNIGTNEQLRNSRYLKPKRRKRELVNG